MQHRLLVIAAPSGYGKTSLAREFVHERKRAGACCYWLEQEGQASARPELLTALVVAMGGSAIARRGPDRLVAGSKDEDLLGQVREALNNCEDHEVCLVLDDAAMDDCWVSVVSSLLGATDANLTVVATTRGPTALLSGQLDAFVITADMLRFTQDEMHSLSTAMGAEMEPRILAEISTLTRGQPALVAMAVPYALALDVNGASLADQSLESVRGYLQELIEGTLTSSQKATMVLAAVLGKGHISDLIGLSGENAANDINAISEVVPLVHVEPTGAFSSHQIVQDIVLQKSSVLPKADTSTMMNGVLRVLAGHDRYRRIAFVMLHYLSSQARCCALVEHGEAMFYQGLLRPTLSCIESLSPSLLISCPRLIFLMARILRELGESDESEQKAAVARRLAVEDGDSRLAAEATVFMSRQWLETGREREAHDALSSVLSSAVDTASPDLRALTLAFHAIASTIVGEPVDRERSLSELDALQRSGALSPEAIARTSLYQGYVSTLIGRADEACARFRGALADGSIGVADELTVRGNLAAALAERGRLGECSRVLADLLFMAGEIGLEVHSTSFCTIEGAMVAAIHDQYDESIRVLSNSAEKFESKGESFYAYQDRLFMVPILRAAGRLDDALDCCERAMTFFAAHENVMCRLLAAVEMSASLVAVGDCERAQLLLSAVIEEVGRNGFSQLALKCTLVRTAIFTRRCEVDSAVAMLERELPYILTGASNWQLAMYVRCFPELLVPLTKLVPSVTPLRDLFNLLPRQLRSEAVDLASPVKGTSHDGIVPYRVVMFGSLAVMTTSGALPSSAWRKRKARVLFAMLAVRRGQETPRDQILDHLWPEMDAERARNNFYVVWSAMKTALMTGAEKGAPCPYIENSHGSCRIVTEHVRLDLDDFDEQLQIARQAESEGESERALAAYERLAEIYRGELLPSDLYDDWFASAREYYRCEFSSAMSQAARLRYEAGDADGALRFVRAALAHDPWREDLYKAAIRYQIATGQRRAAIEMYHTCRHRLAEDLGLDPSLEMRSLYDEILAMEERSAVTVGARGLAGGGR